MDFFTCFLKKYWSLILNVVLVLALISTTGYFFVQDDKEGVVKTEPISLSEVNEEKPGKIYVDVKGAVKKPGVYEMASNSIVNDVINEAGGFTSKAYKNNINLSKKISSEMVIYVYTKSEYDKFNEPANIVDNCNCEDYVIDSCINNGSSIITSDGNVSIDNSKNESLNDSDKSLVNINTATKTELMTLSGVGEAKAENIIKYREDNNGFKSIEELKKVSGIGEAAYEKIKNNITI